MEYLSGCQVNDKAEMQRRGISSDQTMKRVTEMYSEMIFKIGFIHCDPHPGNILIRNGPDKQARLKFEEKIDLFCRKFLFLKK
jgi:aarF domain-containing kinase